MMCSLSLFGDVVDFYSPTRLVFPYGTLQVILAHWTPAEAILLMKIWLTSTHIPDVYKVEVSGL